jgi:hypothetical protein
MTDDEIDRGLRLVQRAIVKHPVAAQAIYSALVREGRAYAETAEGQALRERLVRSEAAARVRTAWEAVSFGMLEHDAKPGAIPSVLVDVFVQAISRARFEARLQRAVQPDDPAGGPPRVEPA